MNVTDCELDEAAAVVPLSRAGSMTAGKPRRWLCMATTVLVVEDDLPIGNLVRTYLKRDGHAVVWVRSGEEALVEIGRHPVGMVLLDIGLPGIDGFEVCRRLRTGSGVPIIMLTARDEETDRVVGLELGADDYVVKPFSPRELAARVKAVLRRAQAADGSDYLGRSRDLPARLMLGDVILDSQARETAVAEMPVELTRKEFDLLVCFATSPGVVLSRERLLESVWELDFPGGTRTVDQHVAQLRAKLGRPDLIQTVRGLGYKAVRS